MKANHPMSYLVAAAFGLSILFAGCGLKGPLYLPDQKAGQTQPAQKADEQKKSETEKK